MTQDTGAEIAIPRLDDGTPISHKWVLIHCSAQGGRMGRDSNHFVALIEELSRAEDKLARLESELAQAQERLKNMNEPFSYGECEQSHELAKSDFKDAIDELVHCVDNANRYLNRRIAINQELATRAASGEK